VDEMVGGGVDMVASASAAGGGASFIPMDAVSSGNMASSIMEKEPMLELLKLVTWIDPKFSTLGFCVAYRFG